MADTYRTIKDLAVRNWWIPVITTVVAALIAAVPTLLAPAKHTATATLKPDTPTFNLNLRLPGPNTMLAQLEQPEFAEQVAKVSGVPADDVEINPYTTGSPPTRLLIDVTAADADTAEQVARVAGEEAVAAAQEAASLEVEIVESNIANAEAALAELEKAPDSTSANAAFYRFSLQNTVETSQKTLQYYRNAYELSDSYPVSSSSPVSEAVKAGLAGALAGLVLGLGLVGLRFGLERWRARSRA